QNDEEEGGEVDGTEVGNEADSDFDYLLVWSLTKEKIEHQKEQAAEKEAELLALLEKLPKDSWNTDIFVKEWKSCIAFEENIMGANGNKVDKRFLGLTDRSDGGTAQEC
ncbi:hypothetical protein GALMADRAFT_134501, partial [Galerina marginata CBS 339.88]